MSVLVVGVSHRTAPVSVLEQLALDPDGVQKLIRQVIDCEHVLEATVLSTCNRIEIYAEVDRFHGSVEAVSRVLCERAVQRPEDIVQHLYVHYDDGAVSHLFNVASGLDSMVVGEGQILGQAREALRLGQDTGSIGPALNVLFQQALRVGKRAHAETDSDGAADIAIANRTSSNAARLAEQYDGRMVELADLDRSLVQADLVISCTGATGLVLPLAQIAQARSHATRPLAIVDLALPHDVDPAVGQLPGVTLVGLARLAEEVNEGEGATDVAAVRSIVNQEITAFLAARRSASVTPTVVALRTMATGVVEAEVDRLMSRLPDLDPQTRAEVELAVRRVADKLLHQPTVRVKELANETGAISYAAALAELFSLDPEAVDAVTRAEGL
jgi:glutamyl-tRNA reductase